MKYKTLQALLLAALATQPLLALADHGHGPAWVATGALEWRLGQRHDIWFRHPGERDWRRAPGSAMFISDGWAIGTERIDGGYGIYRW
ncbi:MAG TPA: hypothetical protein VMH83_00215, partial [Candidatus Acidoferrum sp.]|nr:hypothetical protein [Candidatus Acidoferrum sp.]